MTKKSEITESLARMHSHTSILAQAQFTLGVVTRMGATQPGSVLSTMRHSISQIAKEIRVLEELTGR